MTNFHGKFVTLHLHFERDADFFVAQSLTRTCTSNEIFMSKTNTTLKLCLMAQTSTIVVLGQCKARVRVWDGACAFFMPIPIVLPPTRL